ncbi:ABC-F family ATP-binding cassette domain-containing protein [Cedecea davisae]|uniref:ABC-F family ATP-binding cassette domain-containing protein n=1 Tax=Cedecea davisae TaxID=158484 RepID=A0ABS6DD93_9ENTR|nr:ABC-F family ATP-binding cassette domain-containing protein [Cedecea davisae]MBU4681057.1 ABC-F family ATP-binding cassette domain-containing protein [Cedecea davisae]MBU4685834.1 ABC-F family ATP-binding cassette domain-containing protein [Cedecea davisae]
MSTLLTAQSLHLDTAFGSLLESITFTLKKGDRIGLIGHNGCGKSTLLKLLDGTLLPNSGSVTRASACLMARVEQHLPESLNEMTMLDAVLAQIETGLRDSERWRVEALLASMGFNETDWLLTSATLSGGQHTRLLLARALISEPDLLLLDEPSNHLDLPTLLWLEQFLRGWSGSFVLVSHDRSLLDNVTNGSWILRDRTLHFFALPCSQARAALDERDKTDAHRRQAEQKEIDRIAASAKRLAIWGKVYDNEDLSRKAKQMEKRIDKLKDEQTELTAGTQWQLRLKGEALPADRLLELEALDVRPAPECEPLFNLPLQRVKSGDRVAIIGRNGCGKSSLLRLLWQQYQQPEREEGIRLHPRVHLGYYDQTLHQLKDGNTLLEALEPFAALSEQERKMSLISAGFPWLRHQQTVSTLSGGERSRLLFVGLTLARYSLLMLDEPTNHLDMEGKEALAETLQNFEGGVMLVTHDRELIARGCNRFWLVDNGGLSEWHDLDALYGLLTAEETGQPVPEARSSVQEARPKLWHESDELLERLIELEEKLAEDMARKEKHQKPALQDQWRNEIEALNKKLAI